MTYETNRINTDRVVTTESTQNGQGGGRKPTRIWLLLRVSMDKRAQQWVAVVLANELRKYITLLESVMMTWLMLKRISSWKSTWMS